MCMQFSLFTSSFQEQHPGFSSSQHARCQADLKEKGSDSLCRTTYGSGCCKYPRAASDSPQQPSLVTLTSLFLFWMYRDVQAKVQWKKKKEKDKDVALNFLQKQSSKQEKKHLKSLFFYVRVKRHCLVF